MRDPLGAIWSDFYGEIFENASVSDFLVAYKIYQLCHAEARAAKKLTTISGRERDCRVYGLFHIARTIGHDLLGDSWGHGSTANVESILTKFNEEKLPQGTYKKALDIIVAVRKEDEKEHPIAAMYFKNSVSQRKLNSKLKG